MTTITNIKSQFDQFVPVIKAQIIDQINRDFDFFEEKYGNIGSYKADAWDHGSQMQRQLRSFAKSESDSGIRRPRDPMARDMDRIEKFAQRTAEDQVASYVAKLEKKLVDLTDCEVVDVNGPRFSIKGKAKGRDVVVRQEIILKASSKGKLFNQFPARIYVDGKFMSEAQFKREMGEG